MERSNSTASTASTSSPRPTSGTFAYQTRLLERASSRSGAATLSRSGTPSRSGSVSSANPVSASATSPSPTLTGTRRWTPTHRVGGSLDTVRGKWEERVRVEAELEDKVLPVSPKEDTESSMLQTPPYRSTSWTRSTDHVPLSPSTPDPERTPTYLKRRTLPAPIIASPLSPNSTGVSVENPDPPSSSFSPYTNRIHLPSSAPLHSPSISHVQRLGAYAVSARGGLEPTTTTPRPHRSSTLESVFNHTTGSSTSSDLSITSPRDDAFSSIAAPARTDLFGATRPRPSSLYGGKYPKPSEIRAQTSNAIPTLSRTRSVSPDKLPKVHISKPLGSFSSDNPSHPSATSSSSSVMSPQPYYRAQSATKKTYGDNLIVGRKLGRHLPRIASGDADDDWIAEEKPKPKPKPKPDPPQDGLSSRERRLRTREGVGPTTTNRRPALAAPATPNADDVTGIPGRLRLSRKIPAAAAAATPLPSSRLTRGLWADTQRHLIQAYEYLCHVGEAQQWIEGCLGEELGFGVVEMEDGLRNGVVLAKLVRVFQGEGVVRRIYEAPKLDFRHSDNINYFVNFVRHVGLPESFIFELTDLYEKKNLPKAIYCIHALSHLLARRGMAERIGNLLGRLQFSDDQLQKTQKGLKDAGVPMPNFGNVGRELAMEINEEPEIEVETEDERRDRLLLENEESIVATQSVARAYLIRKTQATRRARLQLSQRYIQRFQATARGALARRMVEERRENRTTLLPWAINLQTVARGVIIRRRWLAWVRKIHARSSMAVKVQAHARGYLVRRRFLKLKAAVVHATVSVVKLQTVARARIVQRERRQLLRVCTTRVITQSIVGLQAAARGALQRRHIAGQLHAIDSMEPAFICLQAQVRGILVRRRFRTQLAKLEDVTHTVVRIQAAVRTYLARKRLLTLIRGLRKATPILVKLQARARASLARQHHNAMNKALSKVEIVTSVGGFQARARAALMRNRHREQAKQLEFSAPDVKGFQATARGALSRREWYAWRDHVRRSGPIAVYLQALLRGSMLRKNFRAKMQYYRENLDKVIKIQSLFRAKETRDQYRQLTLGTNVTVGTIKNFVHLLDDSEADFQEEVDLERRRKQVVERIRENQALENDVNDLDVKIALVVHNVKTFEELVKARRRYGADTAAAHAARASVLAAHGDPFAGPNTLDHAAKRKLELYQQLFYLLQSRGEYLGKLFQQMSSDSVPEKNRRLLERVVLTLFGYGQDRREDYLLLKLFQFAIVEEVHAAKSISDILHGHPVYINIALHYVRPKQTTYVRETLQPLIRDVIGASDLDLEVDPALIHRARVELEEMRAGVTSPKKNVTFSEALSDPVTRAEYIRHLQVLRWWTEIFITAITQSTKKIPFSLRYMARETLTALRAKFPDTSDEVLATCLGRLVYYRYINPAIITPETFDIVSSTLDISTRKNLAQISKVLAQVTSGKEFDDTNPSYIPINDYVRIAITQFTSWLLEVANVSDAEGQYHAHDFLDATVQPKPIYISPNEVYAMHGLLSQHLELLAPSRDDPLYIILHDLDGVPQTQLGSDELKDARDRAITMELTNRFAHVKDPRAEEKTLWIQAKRTVLAILRVQPGKDLVESLMQPVSDDHEALWEEVLETEMEADNRLHHPRRMPSVAAQESTYRLEDIRSLSFREVKAHAIFFLLELEKGGKISRNDGYQGILNAIANDVRSKHRTRLQRQQEIDGMTEALAHLNERKKYFEEQIDSYNSYVEAAMATMQRGKSKKRLIMPFTKQYFHMRDLQKNGKTPQFGSFKYSAQDLYERGILLSIDQFSPRQFDKIDLVFSSNQLGVFTIEVFNGTLGITNRVATAEVRLEDLLQAQFQDRASLSLFNGLAKFNLNLLLYQINKKFYV
ncbi:hypothetical protein OF83DRAFT_1129415 [Amylostereum chailletii]|nr:hypothetical protein OF83DRAFT_1129415 [Amylostereum chailletii]